MSGYGRICGHNDITRLANGECNIEAGVIFLDAISNLERISDHADNIAGYVKNTL